MQKSDVEQERSAEIHLEEKGNKMNIDQQIQELLNKNWRWVVDGELPKEDVIVHIIKTYNHSQAGVSIGYRNDLGVWCSGKDEPIEKMVSGIGMVSVVAWQPIYTPSEYVKKETK